MSREDTDKTATNLIILDEPAITSGMYGADADDRSSSGSELDLETVKPAATDSDHKDNPFKDNFVLDRFHQDLMFATENSDDEDSEAIEEDFRQGANLEDIFFQDLSPDVPHSLNRLDTVEEVTEPASSEIFPDDDARIGSSGQPSSDFQQDSLPPDHGVSFNSLSAKNSMTSREENFSISEIDVAATIWPHNHLPSQGAFFESAQGSQASAAQGNVTPHTFGHSTQTASDGRHLNLAHFGAWHSNFHFEGGSNFDAAPRIIDITNEDTLDNSNGRLETGEQQKQSHTKVPSVNGVVTHESSKEEESTSSGPTSEISQLRQREEHKIFINQDPVDDCDETDSDNDDLSISLPSEGDKGGVSSQIVISTKLTHVQTEILKIFATDDEESDQNQTSSSSSERFKDRAHVYVVNDNQEEDEDSSINEDILKFSEKHEFEDVEKGRSEKRDSSTTMSTTIWSSEDVVDDAGIRVSPPMDNDSGIDRDGGVTSRVSGSSAHGLSSNERGSNKIWTKIHKQVKRRFGGSTGSLSSTSPVSEQDPRPLGVGEIIYSPEIARMESPKEGGFESFSDGGQQKSVSLMRSHIKELMTKLATAEEDKQKIADEAYRRVQIIQHEADAKVESAAMAQAKQASLVDRLQAKVVKYKEQCQVMESRLFEVNQLANQSQIRLKDTNEVLKTLEERLRMTEDRHTHEIRSYQVKLEEEEERRKTVSEVNSVLRDQLDKAVDNNQALAQNIQRLATDWEKVNRQLIEKEEQWKLLSHTKLTVDHQKVLNLWQELNSFKRQFTDLKIGTERDLVTLKNDMSNSGRNLTNACLNVYTNSNYLNVGEGGKPIHVGSKHDLWMQLQRVKVEKQLADQHRLERDSRIKKLSQEVEQLGSRLKEMNQEKEELEKEYNNLKQQAESQVEVVGRSRDLESQNNQLHSSLLNIAQIVIEDAEKHDKEDNSEVNMSTSIFVTPSSSSRHYRNMGSPTRGRSASLPRRTRSASPAVVESTLTAVQAALNRRQLQVHELRTKLTGYSDKIDDLSKSVRTKDEIIESVESKLTKERLELDTTKITLDEVRREKLRIQEQLEMLHVEKAGVERSRTNIQMELENLMKERTSLKESNSKLSKEFHLLQTEHEHTEKANEKLSKEIKDKMNLIGQLEKVGSSLREELLLTKNEVQKLSKSLEVSMKEKQAKEESANSLQSQSTATEEEKLRLKKEERSLKETIAKLESSQSSLNRNIQILEEQLTKVEEDRTKLKLELTDHKSTIQTLKEEVEDSNHRSNQLAKEKKGLQESLLQEIETRDKLESELKRSSQQRDEVENQLTSVTLEKDVLHDEVDHVRKEMLNIRDHLDKVCDENCKLNKQRSELEVRLDQTRKEMIQMEERLKFMRNEKSDQLAMVDDMQIELDECIIHKKKFETENVELKSKLENQRSQQKLQQSELEKEIVEILAQKNQLELERDEIKERSSKMITKLKSEIEESEDQMEKQKEESKRILEKKLKEESNRLVKEYSEKIYKLESELDEVRAECEALKQVNTEDAVLAESEKQQGLLMAQQELLGMREKMEDISRNLEDSKMSLERLKRESQSRTEKDRNQIAELQLEVSRLKGQLEESSSKYQSTKQTLNEMLQREKEAKFETESTIDSLRKELTQMTGRADSLSDELYETKRKLNQISDSKNFLQDELNEAEQRLAETRNQVELLDKIKLDLQNSVRHFEFEKLEDQKLLQRMESQLVHLEKGSLEDRREMGEYQNKFKELQDQNQNLIDQVDSLQRQLRSAEGDNRELELHLSSHKERTLEDEEQRDVLRRESQQLRIRLTEVETAKINLERELAAARAIYEGEEESVKLKVNAMSQAMDEMRARERKLEDQRHNLELALSDAQQEIKSLNIGLTGYEGRIGEMQTTIARLETTKRDVEIKLISICNMLNQFRSPTGSASRPATPTHSGRSGIRRASSPWTPGSTLTNVADIDIEAVKTSIRDLVTRINISNQERDESLHQVSTLKRQNDELLMNTVQLETQLNKSKMKISGTEEQLRKLEHKVSISDVNVANQEVELQKRERELKQLSSRLESTSKQLEDLHLYGANSDDQVRMIRTEKNKLETEKRKLQETLNDLESQNSRLEVARKSLEGDCHRLQTSLIEKDSEIKTLRSKCESFVRGISSMEDKCSSLAATVDHLNLQLERSVQNESELQSKVTELSRSLNATSSSSHEIQDQIGQLQRSLSVAENDKKLLEDRSETYRQQSSELKRSYEALQEKLAQLQSDLQRSESRANQCELALQTSRAQLENNAQDNYLREELGRMRRENDDMQQRIRELSKKVSMVESDKEDLEKRLQHKGKLQRLPDQVDHVRAQIPLMGGRSPSNYGSPSPHHSHFHHSESASPVFHHHHHCGDHLIQIRRLEQENDRQLRKIRALEQQLTELEQLHGERVQELLQERRRERDKENQRQKETLRQMESSLSAKEKIFKDRIYGLEEQVNVLKDQLSKEMRRRQTLITGTSGISHEISELRQNLDQSLYNVSSAAESRLDARVLDRETGRLNSTVDRFGADLSSRLTPSKLHSSTPADGQRIGLVPATSLPRTRRTLTFDMET